MLNPRDILRAAFRTGGGSPTPTTTAVLVPGPTAEAGDNGLFSDVDSRIIVCVRVRPPPAGERPIVTVRDADDHVFVEDPTSSATAGADPLRVGRSRERAFAFDVSCGAAATTAHVYARTARPLVSGVLGGINSTVFAYGQTGAGKTHTMIGDDDNPGVMVLMVADLFRRAATAAAAAPARDLRHEVGVSFLEVYNENLRDLIAGGGDAYDDASDDQGDLPPVYLEMREDPLRGAVVVGLTEVIVSDASAVMALLAKGNRRRTTHATAANKTSSRSHAVLQVIVRTHEDASASASASATSTVSRSKLSLVDLAGSERAKVAKTRSARLEEGANINRSLLALGNCISALAKGSKNGAAAFFVPYRDSKLTRLLKDSLGGNCRTVKIACVGSDAASFEETCNTLKYANRAKNIRVRAHKNTEESASDSNAPRVVAEYEGIVVTLRGEIDSLRTQLAQERMGRSGGRSPTSAARLSVERLSSPTTGDARDLLRAIELDEATLTDLCTARLERKRAVVDLDTAAALDTLEAARRRQAIAAWLADRSAQKERPPLLTTSLPDPITGFATAPPQAAIPAWKIERLLEDDSPAALAMIADAEAEVRVIWSKCCTLQADAAAAADSRDLLELSLLTTHDTCDALAMRIRHTYDRAIGSSSSSSERSLLEARRVAFETLVESHHHQLRIVELQAQSRVHQATIQLRELQASHATRQLEAMDARRDSQRSAVRQAMVLLERAHSDHSDGENSTARASSDVGNSTVATPAPLYDNDDSPFPSSSASRGSRQPKPRRESYASSVISTLAAIDDAAGTGSSESAREHDPFEPSTAEKRAVASIAALALKYPPPVSASPPLLPDADENDAVVPPVVFDASPPPAALALTPRSRHPFSIAANLFGDDGPAAPKVMEEDVRSPLHRTAFGFPDPPPRRKTPPQRKKPPPPPPPPPPVPSSAVPSSVVVSTAAPPSPVRQENMVRRQLDRASASLTSGGGDNHLAFAFLEMAVASCSSADEGATALPPSGDVAPLARLYVMPEIGVMGLPKARIDAAADEIVELGCTAIDFSQFLRIVSVLDGDGPAGDGEGVFTAAVRRRVNAQSDYSETEHQHLAEALLMNVIARRPPESSTVAGADASSLPAPVRRRHHKSSVVAVKAGGGKEGPQSSPIVASTSKYQPQRRGGVGHRRSISRDSAAAGTTGILVPANGGTHTTIVSSAAAATSSSGHRHHRRGTAWGGSPRRGTTAAPTRGGQPEPEGHSGCVSPSKASRASAKIGRRHSLSDSDSWDFPGWTDNENDGREPPPAPPPPRPTTPEAKGPAALPPTPPPPSVAHRPTSCPVGKNKKRRATLASSSAPSTPPPRHRGASAPLSPASSPHDAADTARVKVYVRKRPARPHEADVTECIPPHTVVLHQPMKKVDLTEYVEAHAFAFDRCFGERDDNEAIYKHTLTNLVDAVFDGRDATCFCFGQTSSGKTHTLFGYQGKTAERPTEDGLYLLAGRDVFRRLLRFSASIRLSLRISMFEVYGQKMMDLLNNRAPVSALEDGRKQLQIRGLSEHECPDLETFERLAVQALGVRSTAPTGMNKTSSRSHAVMQLVLYDPTSTRRSGGGGARGPYASPQAKTAARRGSPTPPRGGNSKAPLPPPPDEAAPAPYAKLSLIDLAGSERGADTSDKDPRTRQEGKDINTSLLVLKEVIRALDKSSRKSHAPFRQSMLTRVLKGSMVEDDCPLCVLACIAPGTQHVENTLNTLRYASKLKEEEVPASSAAGRRPRSPRRQNSF